MKQKMDNQNDAEVGIGDDLLGPLSEDRSNGILRAMAILETLEGIDERGCDETTGHPSDTESRPASAESFWVTGTKPSDRVH